MNIKGTLEELRSFSVYELRKTAAVSGVSYNFYMDADNPISIIFTTESWYEPRHIVFGSQKTSFLGDVFHITKDINGNIKSREFIERISIKPNQYVYINNKYPKSYYMIDLIPTYVNVIKGDFFIGSRLWG